MASITIDGNMTQIAFTIGTLVTNPDLYAGMLNSFREKGFGDDCEYIKIDNTGTQQIDAYAGLNILLNQAKAPFVILCHQDVVLLEDGRKELEARLRELSEIDPNWALAGNAGGSGPLKLHIRITDKGRKHHIVNDPFPVRVYTLDENFIIVKAESRISLSRDLSGFHMYGADICMVADMLGWNSYVIDFHLLHLGEGRMGEPFAASVRQFQKKWNMALRGRYLRTTCTHVLLTGGNDIRSKLYFIYLKNYNKMRRFLVSVKSIIARRIMG